MHAPLAGNKEVDPSEAFQCGSFLSKSLSDARRLLLSGNHTLSFHHDDMHHGTQLKSLDIVKMFRACAAVMRRFENYEAACRTPSSFASNLDRLFRGR